MVLLIVFKPHGFFGSVRTATMPMHLFNHEFAGDARNDLQMALVWFSRCRRSQKREDGARPTLQALKENAGRNVDGMRRSDADDSCGSRTGLSHDDDSSDFDGMMGVSGSCGRQVLRGCAECAV